MRQSIPERKQFESAQEDMQGLLKGRLAECWQKAQIGVREARTRGGIPVPLVSNSPFTLFQRISVLSVDSDTFYTVSCEFIAA